MIILNEKICQVKIVSRKPCGRPIYREEKCIFHLPNKDKKEKEIFEKEFCKEFDRMEKSNSILELNFDNFIFQDYICFKNHTFNKPLSLSCAEFSKCADFTEAKFKYRADFSSAKFNGRADFTNAQFNDVADFNVAIFNDNADFMVAEFKNEAIFESAEFNKIALFTQAQFNNEAGFSYVQFNDEAIFRWTQFNGEANFFDSEFRGKVLFGSEFTPILNNKYPINFQYCKFYKPQDVRFQYFNLSNVSFLYTDVTEVEFINEVWGKKKGKIKGRIIVVDESRIMKDENITYDAVAQLYRRLRRNYEDNYRFAEAGDFFIGEMEMRRLDVTARFKNENIRKIELWLNRNVFSLLGIYKFFSLYGESYIRPAICAFIVIILYPLLIHWHNASPINFEDFLSIDIIRSLASFFQMDSTYIPERIIGIPILALLLIALKRKFERKR